MARTFAATAAPILMAAGDPTRLRILELLGVRPHSVSELCAAIGIRQQAATYHLAILRLRRLVLRDRRGKMNFYVLTAAGAQLLGAAYAAVA